MAGSNWLGLTCSTHNHDLFFAENWNPSHGISRKAQPLEALCFGNLSSGLQPKTSVSTLTKPYFLKNFKEHSISNRGRFTSTQSRQVNAINFVVTLLTRKLHRGVHNSPSYWFEVITIWIWIKLEKIAVFCNVCTNKLVWEQGIISWKSLLS